MDRLTVFGILEGQPLLAIGLFIAAVASVGFYHLATSKSNKGGIPSIAPRWKEWFCIAAYKNGKDYLDEGYRKYPNACFRMPLFPLGNMVIVNGPKLVAEVKNGSDDVFSFTKSAHRKFQFVYTVARNVTKSRYHMPVIRTTLTRNLASIFPDIIDEMRGAFNATYGEDSGWKQFNGLRSLMQIVCRTSNRVLVGKNTCRIEEYQKMNVEYTIAVTKAAFAINLFPPILHPIVGPLFSRRKFYAKMAERLLKDEIEYRLANFEKYGNSWADKPNDYLMWLIEAAPPGYERTAPDLVNRILHINFAAIHTSSLTFTQALLHLAAHPEWIKPMREEVERIVAEDGWTKASMQKMRRTDSFLRESSRMNSIGLTSLGRCMLKDYTFSDGTKVPRGTMVAASSYSVHMDDDYYPDAKTFEPFRFADIRQEAGEEVKHQMVATSPDYLPFGLGKHACPGRFFAANEIKAMLCYLIMNYDVKLPGDAVEKPPNQYFGSAVIPSDADEILIRKRQGMNS